MKNPSSLVLLTLHAKDGSKNGHSANAFCGWWQLVLDAVSSPLTRVMYGHAIDEFFRWWEDQAGRRSSPWPACSASASRAGVGGRPRLVLDRDQLCRLQGEDKSLREISDQMGLSLTTTARILKTA